MVQMKGVDDCLLTVKVFLYIPHGSDERFNIKNSQKTTFNFISHMVQMKGIFGNQLSLLLILLYIPHGSDERIQKEEIG